MGTCKSEKFLQHVNLQYLFFFLFKRDRLDRNKISISPTLPISRHCCYDTPHKGNCWKCILRPSLAEVGHCCGQVFAEWEFLSFSCVKTGPERSEQWSPASNRTAGGSVRGVYIFMSILYIFHQTTPTKHFSLWVLFTWAALRLAATVTWPVQVTELPK